MRRVIASTLLSLDGVLQGPGAPEEDTTGGFALGGWTFSFWADAMGESMKGFDARAASCCSAAAPTRSSRRTGLTSRPATRSQRRSTRRASTSSRAR